MLVGVMPISIAPFASSGRHQISGSRPHLPLRIDVLQRLRAGYRRESPEDGERSSKGRRRWSLSGGANPVHEFVACARFRRRELDASGGLLDAYYFMEEDGTDMLDGGVVCQPQSQTQTVQRGDFPNGTAQEMVPDTI